MRLAIMKPTMTKLIVLLATVAALTVTVMWSSVIRPAAAQPPCAHQWCDWYQVCKWEYWGWDSDTGWVLISTDGDC